MFVLHHELLGRCKTDLIDAQYFCMNYVLFDNEFVLVESVTVAHQVLLQSILL